MARVFLSHASEDGALADEVHRWLTDGDHDVFLDQDLYDGIQPGDEWEPRLHKELRRADAVVCVLTSAYLTSTWCTAEVGIARSLGRRVLPILAEPGAFHPLLKATQHITLVGDEDAARQKIEEALRQIDAGARRGWSDDVNPFPGLLPFDADRRAVFFGRDTEVEELAGLLRSPAERIGGGSGVLLVVGPSGSGKSSLVRAGLIPVMAEEPDWLTLSPFLPAGDPVAALTRELAAAAGQRDLGWTIPVVRDRLRDRGLHGLADELLLAKPGKGRRRHLLVVVDQFEQLLGSKAPDLREFAELLRPALDRQVISVVATLRPEFLDQMLTSPELVDLPTRLYTLSPLRRDALATIIKGPARIAGIEIDDELVDKLVAETGTGDALPLLAFTLEQLAKGVARGGRLSMERYKELGGVEDALVLQADAALAAAKKVDGRGDAEVIGELLELVTLDEWGHITRARVSDQKFSKTARDELEAFRIGGLLTFDTEEHSVVIGMTHDKFLTAWTPLAKEIEKQQSGWRMGRLLEREATEWNKAGRPFSRLWYLGQLATAVKPTRAHLRWRARVADDPGRRPGLTSQPPQRRPGWRPWRHWELVTSKEVRLDPCAREFLYRSMLKDRLIRTILSLLLVAVIVAACYATVQEKAAKSQQRIAVARLLVAQAEAARATDPRFALKLGVTAQQVHPDTQTYASLVSTLTTTRYAGSLTDHTDELWSVAFSQAGNRLATGSRDGTVGIWDMTDPTAPRRDRPPLAGRAGGVYSVAFTPDGSTLATGHVDGTVILWDLRDDVPVARLRPGVPGRWSQVWSVAFAPDGRTLAVASGDGALTLWDVAVPRSPRQIGPALTTGAALPPERTRYPHPFTVAFAPDGRTLASGGFGSTAQLWDVSDPSRPVRLGRPLAGHRDEVWVVAFDRGHRLATGSRDGSVLLWDLADRRRPRQLGPPLRHQDEVWTVAFSPDGSVLASAGRDKSVILWDLTDPSQPVPVGTPLAGHRDAVQALAFAPTGRTLASGSLDKSVGLWDLTEATRATRLGPALNGLGRVLTIALTANGERLATGSTDGTLALWNIADRARPVRLTPPMQGHGGLVRSVAFAPDGRTLASAGDDRSVLLWDVTDPARPRRIGPPLKGHTDNIRTVAFSPDGRTLASGGGDGDNNVLLWDVSRPAHGARIGPPLRGAKEGQGRGIQSLAFSPDGSMLASGGGDQALYLWNVTDPAKPRRLASSTEHSAGVRGVTFAPMPGTVATASGDKTTLLWSVTDPSKPAPLTQPLTGHRAEVWSVAFDAEGRTLATSGDDGTVRLWDVTDRGRPVVLGQAMIGHTGAIRTVAFADRDTLATVGGDGTVILWDLTGLNQLRKGALQRACALTKGGFNRDEWAHYAPELPYGNDCSNRSS